MFFEGENEKSKQEKYVTGFDYGKYTFTFGNSFEDRPLLGGIGNTKYGLCGGMCVAADMYYKNNIETPATTQSPGTTYLPELFDYLINCQMASVPIDAILKYGMCTFNSDTKNRELIESEWPKIKQAIDNDQTILLGLIRSQQQGNILTGLLKFSEFTQDVTKHHQVLVYGYKLKDGRATLFFYDPARPGNKDVYIAFNTNGTGIETTHSLHPVYSFFKVDHTFNQRPPVLATVYNTNISTDNNNVSDKNIKDNEFQFT